MDSRSHASDRTQVNLRGVIPDGIRHFFCTAGSLAEREGAALGIVGGPVRDWLIGIGIQDFDFVVEGDALTFVRILLDRWPDLFPGTPCPSLSRPFPKFGTVKLLLAASIDGVQELDFASSRRESYPRPGRAPEVVYPVSLREDLGRRDFSVNAMALRFRAMDEAELLDPFGGALDVRSQVLRVLHDASFLEDPARIIRAYRFKTRFGMSFDSKTARLAEEAIQAGGLLTLTPQRRFDELRKALAETNLRSFFQDLSSSGALSQFHPLMTHDESGLERAALLPRGPERQATALGPMLRSVPDSEYESLLKSWGLSRQLSAYFVEVRRHVV